MLNEWRETTLGEVVNFRRGHDLPKTKMQEGTIPVVGSNGIIGYHNKHTTDAPCVSIGRSGNVGNPHIVMEKCWAHNTTLYIDDFKGNDEVFVYYFLQTLNLHNFRGGSAVPTLNRNHIHPMDVRIPPLPEQKAIAHILGSLDDKIELNRKMNETLEAMAQAMFKSWFVDFDPVIDNVLAAGNTIPEELAERAEQRKALGDKRKQLPSEIQKLFPSEFIFTDKLGWIPKGWETSPLGNFITVKRGGSPRPIHDFLVPAGLPWVKISDATKSDTRFISETKQYIKPEGLKKTVLLDKGSLILSNSATPGVPKFLNIDACVHDGWLHFPEITHFSDLYLYQLFLILREELIQQGNGSVFTNLKTDILRNQVVLVPSVEVIKRFDNTVSITFERMNSLNSERQSLSKLRDTLLPKLLSGELRIKDAEKLIMRAEL